MTRVEGDLVQIHVGAGQVGQAKMSRRMGRKLWEAGSLRHVLHNLGPGHQGKRTGGIAMGFGQKKRTRLG